MQYFTNLETLSLSRNYLKDISFLNSENLNTLLDIDLSNNKISILVKDYFQNLKGLNVLNLEDNLLDKVKFQRTLLIYIDA